jgi:hypothetical protein
MERRPSSKLKVQRKGSRRKADYRSRSSGVITALTFSVCPLALPLSF